MSRLVGGDIDFLYCSLSVHISTDLDYGYRLASLDAKSRHGNLKNCSGISFGLPPCRFHIFCDLHMYACMYVSPGSSGASYNEVSCLGCIYVLFDLEKCLFSSIPIVSY